MGLPTHLDDVALQKAGVRQKLLSSECDMARKRRHLMQQQGCFNLHDKPFWIEEEQCGGTFPQNQEVRKFWRCETRLKLLYLKIK